MSLHQLDVLPLRPSAKRILDEMEYSTDASAAAAWSGTGVTVTKDASIFQVGSYSVKAVTDATANRQVEVGVSADLSVFKEILLWERSSQAADTIRFFIEDSGGDQSYWDITTDASPDTWQQDTIDLSSPDGNNGTDADQTDIVLIGFQSLTASKTYYFDQIYARVGMAVAVSSSNIGSFFKHVYLSNQPTEINDSASPAITAPTTNPRIDVLSVDQSGTLAWTVGTEASSPTIPWSSVPSSNMPICLVYCKTTMTKVVDYHEKDAFTNDGYIYADIRPIMRHGFTMVKGSDVASASNITLPDNGNFFDITGTTTITSITAKSAGTVVWLQFDGILTVTDGSNLKLNGDLSTNAETVLQLVSDGTNWFEVSRNKTVSSFTGLSDTPSSFSGQGLKAVRVNTGATALEFFTLNFLTLSDTPSTFSSQAKKVAIVNAAETALTFEYPPHVAGTGLTISNVMSTNRTTGNSTYTKAKESSAIDRSGTVRVEWEMQQVGGTTGQSKVYVNGSPVGTEKSVAAGAGYVAQNDTIPVSAGDVIQVYMKTNAGAGDVHVRNMVIKVQPLMTEVL